VAGAVAAVEGFDPSQPPLVALSGCDLFVPTCRLMEAALLLAAATAAVSMTLLLAAATLGMRPPCCAVAFRAEHQRFWGERNPSWAQPCVGSEICQYYCKLQCCGSAAVRVTCDFPGILSCYCRKKI
jgi:hypothetical protein